MGPEHLTRGTSRSDDFHLDPTGVASKNGGMSPDDDLHERISALVGEEHNLRNEGASPEHARRLGELERQLDQVWDLLRRRQAAREFGQDPSQAREQSESQVEGYLQ